ncbi:MAG: O-antigen ligase family protein, partial [Phascolarctobacterium sp.]|nr:O-antigen ligase family protein [Phascolarctobacterium sp.]
VQGYKKLKKQERNEFNKSYSKFRFEYSLSKLNHAHNNILQMLAENGMVGFVGYIFAFGFIVWKNFKNFLLNKNPYALMIVGSTSALVLQGLTEYNFGNSSVMKIYWLVLACLIILASKYNDGMKNE